MKAIRTVILLGMAWAIAGYIIYAIDILLFVDSDSEVSPPLVSVLAAVAVGIWVIIGVWPFQKTSMVSG
jgi:uncharacterized membrane protein (GlpM family)